MCNTKNNNNLQGNSYNNNCGDTNISAYDSLMKSVETSTAAEMRPITEGFSWLGEDNNK